jgi:hypothetical protein
MLPTARQRGRAGGGAEDIVARDLQGLGDCDPDVNVVIDQQYLRHS